MKNKKSLLSLGLLALVLVLGVGYAVVSSVTLEINGQATTLDSSDIAVTFTGDVDYPENSEYIDATNTKADANETTASIGVKNLSRINDSVTVTYTIQNTETDIAATLEKPTITNDNTEYFTVTTEYVDGAETQSLPATNTTTLEVTVTLKKSPTTAVQTANIGIELVAAPEAQ